MTVSTMLPSIHFPILAMCVLAFAHLSTADQNRLLFQSVMGGLLGSPARQRDGLSAARAGADSCGLAVKHGDVCAGMGDRQCAWQVCLA
jgi:hypothetical protein